MDWEETRLNFWEIAILMTIKSLGGEAGLQQIYRRLPDFKPLDEKALRINPKYGKRPLYHHWVRSHIKDLCQKDDLEKISRAYYSLTDKGIRRLNSLIPLLRKLKGKLKKSGFD